MKGQPGSPGHTSVPVPRCETAPGRRLNVGPIFQSAYIA